MRKFLALSCYYLATSPPPGVENRIQNLHNNENKNNENNKKNNSNKVKTDNINDGICVMIHEDSFQEVGEKIAKNLNIPFFTSEEEDYLNNNYSHVLDIIPFDIPKNNNNDDDNKGRIPSTYAIGLRSGGGAIENNDSKKKNKKKKKRKSNNKTKPFLVDFNLEGRKSNNNNNADLLIKAVGPNKIPGGAVIYDLTAGFGQDSFLLLLAGASKVHMIEKNPIVATLLQDGLRRLELCYSSSSNNDENESIDDFHNSYEDRISLHVGDGTMITKSLTDTSLFPHICYLDPMFPPRTKTAAVKKNMQLLHTLLQDNDQEEKEPTKDLEESNLLLEALRIAKNRVVVKRPINALPLGAASSCNNGNDNNIQKPSYSIKGSINRWDIYVTNNNK